MEALRSETPRFSPMQVEVELGGERVQALIDSGAGLSVIQKAWLERLPDKSWSLVPSTVKLQGMTGQMIPADGSVELSLTMDQQSIQAKFVVMTNLNVEVIIGNDILSQQGVVIDYRARRIYCHPPTQEENRGLVCPLIVAERTKIPARSIQNVSVHTMPVLEPEGTSLAYGTVKDVSSLGDQGLRCGEYIQVPLRKMEGQSHYETVLPIINPGTQTVFLPARTIVAFFKEESTPWAVPLEQCDVVEKIMTTVEQTVDVEAQTRLQEQLYEHWKKHPPDLTNEQLSSWRNSVLIIQEYLAISCTIQVRQISFPVLLTQQTIWQLKRDHIACLQRSMRSLKNMWKTCWRIV